MDDVPHTGLPVAVGIESALRRRAIWRVECPPAT